MDADLAFACTSDHPHPAPADGVTLSALDRGYVHGESVYETLRTYHARPFASEAHLDRLASGLSRLGVAAPPAAHLASALEGLARNRAPHESLLRVQVSAGLQFPGAPLRGPARWAAFAGPLPAHVSALYERGVRCALAPRPRWNPGGFVPAVKFAGNPDLALARAWAQAGGFFEALLLSPSGELAEGASTNVFLVRGRRVITPHLDSGILDGVTRSRVLALCPKAGLETEVRRVDPEELFTADEVFLTATTREVVPVVRIGERTIGHGEPGLITDRLLGLYQESALESTRGVPA